MSNVPSAKREVLTALQNLQDEGAKLGSAHVRLFAAIIDLMIERFGLREAAKVFAPTLQILVTRSAQSAGAGASVEAADLALAEALKNLTEKHGARLAGCMAMTAGIRLACPDREDLAATGVTAISTVLELKGTSRQLGTLEILAAAIEHSQRMCGSSETVEMLDRVLTPLRNGESPYLRETKH